MLDLSALRRALDSLRRGLGRLAADPADEEVRDACIQRFEFTYELCWKMLKRRLESDLPVGADVDGMTWRTLIRTGFERGLIAAVEPWWIYRDKRNITSHTYDPAKAAEVVAILPAFSVDAAALLEALEQRGGADG